MKVIGICGEIGAGKDTFADYLVNKKDFQKVIMSDMISLELKRLERPINREEMQKLSPEYKEKYGKGVWAKACLEYAKEKGIRRVVISGIRDSEEIKVFRQMLGNDFLLIYITADKEIRHKRIIERKGPKDPQNTKEVEKQEQKEKEIFDIYENFNDMADQRITNNGMIIELWANADLILKEKGFESKDY